MGLVFMRPSQESVVLLQNMRPKQLFPFLRKVGQTNSKFPFRITLTLYPKVSFFAPLYVLPITSPIVSTMISKSGSPTLSEIVSTFFFSFEKNIYR